MAEAEPASLRRDPWELVEARGEIENLLERYCWLSDHGQLDDWAACFAPGAVLRIRDTELRGRDAIRLEMGERLRRRFRFLRHLSHQASVSLADESHAVARSYFELRGATAEGREIEALGSYEDDLVKTTEGWKLSYRVVEFTYFVHRGEPWEGDLYA
jgi:SnoaL-like domain